MIADQMGGVNIVVKKKEWKKLFFLIQLCVFLESIRAKVLCWGGGWCGAQGGHETSAFLALPILVT